jgi:tRNA threonylcarbamoyladenosine biosynthesis protein TsaE
MSEQFSVLSRQVAETERIAATLAAHLRAGDILLLTGDLACGKTAFVKGLAAALGSTDTVTSPTYALVHNYRTDRCDVMHIDAYRVESVREFTDLGLDEYFPECIVAIEWGDKVAGLFGDHLRIAFDLADAHEQHRLLSFDCSGERWGAAMTQLAAELAVQRTADCGGVDGESPAGH